ncbi:MAG: hypothetical protein CL816_03370 [Coxiellaceae bacterium]|nr:hypothetical protein [Coxiellaceae bacterium]
MAKKRNRSINTSFKRHSYKQRQQTEKRLMLQRPSTLRAYGEAVQLSEVSSYEIPEGLTVGRPFKTLGLGQVSSRMSGDAIGKEIDVEMLTEMVRVFNARKENDPVIIDWQHATSPFQSGSPAPPESGNALGLIIDLDLRDDGLYATPAYNERGLDVVTKAGGVLWSSPEFLAGEVFDRLGGSKVGDAQLLAITLTPRPAQSHDQIDRVTLTEEIRMDSIDSMSPEELKQMLIAKDEMVKELEDQIKEMKQDAEASLKTESKDDNDESLKEEKDDDEKAKKLAHTPDHEEKAEKKDYKMSEDLSPMMLSEIQALNEKVSAQDAEIKKLRSERDAVECGRAIDMLLSEGKVSPSEKSTAEKAWELREIQPEFWQMFSSRESGSSVPLAEIGHGASGAEVTKQSLDLAVRKLSTEKSITYSEALAEFRADNPDYYLKAFGG